MKITLVLFEKKYLLLKFDYRKYDRLMILGFSILSNFQFFVRHIL